VIEYIRNDIRQAAIVTSLLTLRKLCKNGNSKTRAARFLRPTTDTSGPYPPGIPATALPEGRFPLDLELEFAEMRAAAPVKSAWPVLLASGALFQVILIAEYRSHLLPNFDFGVRGICATLVLLAAALSLAGGRTRGRQPAWIMLCCMLLTSALAGGIVFHSLDELFVVQTGVALLLLPAGWGSMFNRRWAALGALGVISVDAACMLLGPSPEWLGAPVRIASLWAPGFAGAIVILISLTRHSESRREFLLLRHAAFHGTATADADTRHLDAPTGVAGRGAFDLCYRAAWDAAAARRKPVALLFFSIDALADRKRELGFKFVEALQRQVAGMLQEGLRQSGDMVARFDHQHFVVMLPEVGRDGTTQIAERLRGSIEQMPVYAGRTRHTATVTVGAASMRAKRGIPRENLVDAAVQALEQARAYGPNTVCVEGVGCVPRMS
jgi:diguanylate cyclase (GGDEF)-like protein